MPPPPGNGTLFLLFLSSPLRRQLQSFKTKAPFHKKKSPAFGGEGAGLFKLADRLPAPCCVACTWELNSVCADWFLWGAGGKRQGIRPHKNIDCAEHLFALRLPNNEETVGKRIGSGPLLRAKVPPHSCPQLSRGRQYHAPRSTRLQRRAHYILLAKACRPSALLANERQ